MPPCATAWSSAEALSALLGAEPEALAPPPAPLAEIVQAAANHRKLIDALAAALADEPPLFARDGGFIRMGYRAELDEQRTLRDDSRKTVAALEAKYRTSAGVPSLKIRHNNMIGYHIEVTATHADKLDLAALGFTRRQSMSNATRFSTAELADLETRIGRAADQALALELAIFDALVGGGDGGFGRGRVRRARARRARRCRRVGGARGQRQLRAAGAGGRTRLHHRRRPASRRRGGSAAPGRLGLRAQRLRARPRTPAVAADRPQHGRQVDLPAPERVDRRDGSGRLLRAGQGGDDRHRRSPVQPRRRGRRSGARAVDLHGRDGRDGGDPQPGDGQKPRHPGRDRPRHGDLRRPLDRLGNARASARRQQVPRAVRHALPRARRAQGAAGGARALHHARQGMAERGGVPARGGAGRRRPLLRHPCRAACRPAGAPW